MKVSVCRMTALVPSSVLAVVLIADHHEWLLSGVCMSDDCFGF